MTRLNKREWVTGCKNCDIYVDIVSKGYVIFSYSIYFSFIQHKIKLSHWIKMNNMFRVFLFYFFFNSSFHPFCLNLISCSYILNSMDRGMEGILINFWNKDNEMNFFFRSVSPSICWCGTSPSNNYS